MAGKVYDVCWSGVPEQLQPGGWKSLSSEWEGGRAGGGGGGEAAGGRITVEITGSKVTNLFPTLEAAPT